MVPSLSHATDSLTPDAAILAIIHLDNIHPYIRGASLPSLSFQSNLFPPSALQAFVIELKASNLKNRPTLFKRAACPLKTSASSPRLPRPSVCFLRATLNHVYLGSRCAADLLFTCVLPTYTCLVLTALKAKVPAAADSTTAASLDERVAAAQREWDASIEALLIYGDGSVLHASLGGILGEGPSTAVASGAFKGIMTQDPNGTYTLVVTATTADLYAKTGASIYSGTGSAPPTVARKLESHFLGRS
ncbi:hypothetical protein MIND_00015000 [Mycena indigotica]|uniref:Uncharacterized protein n=1 Tax=Mycena indigotica TaxID=2126181 RepID=A0A8H6WJX3_9AGAR|nr:uncharacterized protein MIND_00015000 [Mycena indigotica]KAF7315009.1 hypothetical protein MIND_00015000 [Mycena indigotica]